MFKSNDQRDSASSKSYISGAETNFYVFFNGRICDAAACNMMMSSNVVRKKESAILFKRQGFFSLLSCCNRSFIKNK